MGMIVYPVPSSSSFPTPFLPSGPPPNTTLRHTITSSGSINYIGSPTAVWIVLAGGGGSGPAGAVVTGWADPYPSVTIGAGGYAGNGGDSIFGGVIAFGGGRGPGAGGNQRGTSDTSVFNLPVSYLTALGGTGGTNASVNISSNAGGFGTSGGAGGGASGNRGGSSGGSGLWAGGGGGSASVYGINSGSGGNSLITGYTGDNQSSQGGGNYNAGGGGAGVLGSASGTTGGAGGGGGAAGFASTGGAGCLLIYY